MLICQWLRHLNTQVWQMILPIDIDWVNANDLTAENVASRLADAEVSSFLVVSVNVVQRARFKLFVMHVKMMCQCWVSVSVCN